MKTFFTILICVGLSGVAAQDLRDHTRFINGKAFSIAPLIGWWTNAVSITESNKTLRGEKKIVMPARPLPAWIRVSSAQITNTGFVWIADAEIQQAPDKTPTRQKIVLRHGPFEEKKKVDDAAARFDEATKNRNAQIEWAEFHAARSKNLDARGTMYQEVRNAGGGKAFGNLASDYNSAARAASQSADANRNRAANLDAERERLAKITRGRTSMTVDSFALKTSDTYNGLPVYEMGLRYGR